MQSREEYKEVVHKLLLKGYTIKEIIELDESEYLTKSIVRRMREEITSEDKDFEEKIALARRARDRKRKEKEYFAASDQVLSLIKDGKTNDEIMKELNISGTMLASIIAEKSKKNIITSELRKNYRERYDLEIDEKRLNSKLISGELDSESEEYKSIQAQIDSIKLRLQEIENENDKLIKEALVRREANAKKQDEHDALDPKAHEKILDREKVLEEKRKENAILHELDTPEERDKRAKIKFIKAGAKFNALAGYSEKAQRDLEVVRSQAVAESYSPYFANSHFSNRERFLKKFVENYNQRIKIPVKTVDCAVTCMMQKEEFIEKDLLKAMLVTYQLNDEGSKAKGMIDKILTKYPEHKYTKELTKYRSYLEEKYKDEEVKNTKNIKDHGEK